MQAVVNEQLVRTRIRIASACHIAALAVFAVGLFYSWNWGPSDFEQIVASYVAIIIGLILYQVGQVFLRRWGPRSRADALLIRTLKGLDNRHTLVAFAAAKLPDYVVVGPAGVRVIVPRSQDGEVTCQADRWSHSKGQGLGRFLALFGGNPIGNPTADATDGVRKIKSKLESAGLTEADYLDVRGIVVFSSPAVRLRIEGASQTVTRLKQLRGALSGGAPSGGANRASSGKSGLNAKSVQRIVDALRS
ncbi:MAG: hypothetical protein U0821_20090 [Chloroflexota bacterium]